jgi:nitroimidazol reductase NimA-like FMN-containing flavoprotein (pyridoxamine 5'-phosphate oxidase superfamily)
MRIDLEHRRSMDESGILELLKTAEVGHIATVDESGMPYVVPVHFVFDGEHIYFHGLSQGKKLDHIRSKPSVCFETYELLQIGLNEMSPCDSWTYYRSVVATGTARILESRDDKTRGLDLLNRKYFKGLFGKMSPTTIDGTCVIEMTIDRISGKHNEK